MHWTARLPRWLQWPLSFVIDVPRAQRGSTKNPLLEVALEAGKLRLNAGVVNYSRGRLEQVFAEAFDEAGMPHWGVKRVLVLGLGAGSVPHLIHKAHPHAHIVGVEWDEAVLELAYEHFGLGHAAWLSPVQADAIPYVKQYAGEPFDLVVVDLFIEFTVPRRAEAPDFVAALRRITAPGGRVVYNRVVDFEADKATARFRPLFQKVFPGFQIYRPAGNEIWVAQV